MILIETYLRVFIYHGHRFVIVPQFSVQFVLKIDKKYIVQLHHDDGGFCGSDVNHTKALPIPCLRILQYYDGVYIEHV